MRFLLLLFIFSISLILIAGRPAQQVNESDRENDDADYDGEEKNARAQDYIQDDRDALNKDRNEDEDSPIEEERDVVYSEANDELSRPKSNNQFLDGQKTGGRNIRDGNDETYSMGNKKNLSDLKSGSNNAPAAAVASANGNMHNLVETNNTPSQTDEEGESLFKSYGDDRKNNVDEKHEEIDDINRKAINGLRKESYNPQENEMRSEKKLDDTYFFERGRRQISSLENSLDTIKNSDKEKDVHNTLESNASGATTDNKELSKQDLEDLFNSLSNEKINILKKIINDNEVVNKREVTKRAGAVADNNYIDSGRFDVTGFQGFNSNSHTESSIANNIDTNKQTESNEISSSITKFITNDIDVATTKSGADLLEVDTQQDKSKLSDSDSNVINTKDASKIKEGLIDNNKEVKNENKREANSDDLSSLKISDYKDLGLDSDSQCVNDWLDSEDNIETQTIEKKFKRDIPVKNDLELTSSVKALEESFPNINSDANANTNLDLAPLVRVKRTSENNNFVERGLDMQYSNDKVPFLPDNVDLEKDENSEMEDYGVYGQDRHVNIIDKNEKQAEINKEQHINMHNNFDANQNIQNFNSERDNMRIGTDTDRVLSSVEGVDENIMYKSGIRKKRTRNNVPNVDLIDNYDNKLSFDSRISDKDENSYLENNENESRLIEADNFGQFLENKDVSRCKRIRQVKSVEPNI